MWTLLLRRGDRKVISEKSSTQVHPTQVTKEENNGRKYHMKSNVKSTREK